MPEILFVHGTGVRGGSYVQTLSLIRKQAEAYLGGVAVRPCLWGDSLGARLNAGGASIPTYAGLPAHNPSQAEAEQIEQAAWQMLAEDPLFEIRVLEYRPAERRERSPAETPPGKLALGLLKGLEPPPAFGALLTEKNLQTYWLPCWKMLANNPELDRILSTANREPVETSRTLARALVAGIITAAREEDHAPISVTTRERLVELLIPDLGGQALGVFDWMTKPLLGIAKHHATSKARRERRALSDAAFPGAGDIALYQARGEKIRGFIRDRILEANGELIVIAHSLGGIATVDLLIQENLSQIVKGVVTVGSQAPFLYEIDALTSLPYGQPLPAHFPVKWLNLWDPNDFLSYVGKEVFGDKAVKDFMIESRLAFPDAHSGYWEQHEVWAEIQRYFPWP